MRRLILIVIAVAIACLPVTGSDFYKNVGVRQAERIIRDHEGKGTLVLLDVRSAGEYANGWIRGAVNINFWSKDFVDSVSKLDRRATYLVYCASGVRSSGAMKKMKELGFGRIYNLKGGMFAWKAKRGEVVKGGG